MGVLTKAIREREHVEGIQSGKGEISPSLEALSMILNQKEKKSLKNSLKSIRHYKQLQQGYQVTNCNMRKLDFYTL